MMGKLKRVFYEVSVLILTVSAMAALGACASAAVQSRSDAEVRLVVPSEPIMEGGVFYTTIEAPELLGELEGTFQGRVVRFYPDRHEDTSPGMHRYSAIVGVEYGTSPGALPLVVRGKHNGKLVESKVDVHVKAGDFPSEKLRVPPRTVTPSKRDRRKIARDRALLKRAYASKVKKRLWDPPAVLPVESAITSYFGTSRVYNGKKQNVHLGTDLRAPTGTPLYVPLTGKVVVARHLFYTGYTVIIDHGAGLFTIYGHLSKLKVKEGKIVKKGSVMGYSGATGRVSGPHLHWGVHLHGTKVDPMALVRTLNRS